MREIKFRGYSKNFNMMILNETWESASDGMVKACNQYMKEHHIDSIPVERGTFLPTKDNDMVLMQYTGLKDKNGKETYEGDIIQDLNGKKYVIKWGINSNGFIAKSTEIHCNVYSSYHLVPKTKIIGNIYENPDVLEG